MYFGIFIEQEEGAIRFYRSERYSCFLSSGTETWNVCHSASRPLCVCGVGDGWTAVVVVEEKDIDLPVRSDPYYMERVGIFMKKVGEQLVPLQITRGR